MSDVGTTLVSNECERNRPIFGTNQAGLASESEQDLFHSGESNLPASASGGEGGVLQRVFQRPVRGAIVSALFGWLFCGSAGLSFEPVGEPAGGPLPRGAGAAHWGMTAEELGRLLPVQKIDTMDQFGYAEHLEQDPDVYAGTTADGKRVEYYLYDNALYKLFIIHARNQLDPQLYQQMVRQLTAMYGPPVRTYEEAVFGLRIAHTVWQDAVTQVDLRFGGGFVFEVHVDRARAAAKDAALKRKKSI